MQTYAIGDIRFTPRTGELGREACEVRLEPKAAAVLEQLCANPGSVVDRQTLLDVCWGEGEGSDEALTQAIAQIRRTFIELGQPATSIQTYPKRGYRLQAAQGMTAFAPPPALEGSRSRKGIAAAAAVIILLATVWASTGHAPRHFIRHQLGLHDMQAQAGHAQEF